MTTQFPYDAFVLTPSLAPKAVTFVSAETYWFGGTWHKSSSGKAYRKTEIYMSFAEAVKASQAALQRAEDNLKKREANLVKKRAAIEKAIKKHEAA